MKDFFFFLTISIIGMPNSIDQYVKFNSEFQVLICLQHKYCLTPNGIERHFQRYHKNIPLAIRKEITQYGSQLNLISPNKVGVSNKVIAELALYESGFKCKWNGCNEYATTERSIMEHCRGHRNWTSSKHWENQAIQTFFQGEHSK